MMTSGIGIEGTGGGGELDFSSNSGSTAWFPLEMES